MDTLASLKQRFAHLDGVSFKRHDNGMLEVGVANRHASAAIALQGAHLMRFQPTAEEPIIWLSPEANPTPGRSLRGGVPVCWPWFGAHHSDPTFPAHGFARTEAWRLNQLHTLPGGETRLEFELTPGAQSRRQWPATCTLHHIITIGRHLRHELVTTNLDAKPMEIGAALHSYFQVGDIRRVRLTALEGCDYLDKVRGFARATQCGPLRFAAEVDRIYLDTPSRCEIIDPSLQRRIVIQSCGSRSTVVWNPWQEVARKMGDMGHDGHLRMLCVETANAATDTVVLAPGAQHRLVADYAISAL